MSARPDTWMPIYWGDYSRDTGHLNAAGHGAYLMLIKHYWCSGAPLRDDDDELWRIACCDNLKEWQKLRPKIVRMFVSGDGLLRHKRIDRELAAAMSSVAAKAEAGKRGAEKRWRKYGAAIAEPSQFGGAAIADPSISHRQTDTPSPSPSESESLTDSKETQTPRARLDANGRVIPLAPPAAPEKPATPAGSVPFDGAAIDRETGRVVVNGWFWDVVLPETYEAAQIDEARWTGTFRPLVAWLLDGIDPDETIIPTIRRIAARPDYRVPSTLQYFDRAVREAHARRPA